MPQGWSIRKLSCFKLPLSGGYENRPEPMGHATYPQPLATMVDENEDLAHRQPVSGRRWLEKSK